MRSTDSAMGLAKQETEEVPQVLRACTSTYVVLCGPLLVLLALYGYLGVVKKANVSVGIAILAGVLGLAISWVRSFRIELTVEGMDYRSPLFRRARVDWAEIASVRSGVNLRSGRAPFYLVITPRDAPHAININIRVFGRQQLAVLASVLRQRSPQAKVDESTRRMSEGKMPAFFRGASMEK